MVDQNGKQFYGLTLETVAPNWLLEDFAHRFQYHVESVVSTFSHLPNFRGISNFISPLHCTSDAFLFFTAWVKLQEDTPETVPLDLSFPQCEF